MALAFRSSTSTTYTSRTNTVVTAPGGIVDGDILILTMALVLAAPPAPTLPAGFTLLTSRGNGVAGLNVNFLVAWKRAAGESGSYTVTHATATTQVVLAAYSGCVGTGLPVEAVSVNRGIGTTATALGITTVSANTMLVYAGHDWQGSGTLTPPTGFTERFDGLVYCADKAQSASGATGNVTLTTANAGTDPWDTIMLALSTTGGGGSILTWVGPLGGGANNGTPVQQTRMLALTNDVVSVYAGQIIQGLNIVGTVRIRHNNVILRQCRVVSGNAVIVQADSGAPTGVVVEDCLIDGTLVNGSTGFNPDSGGGGSIIRRCNITAAENGVGIGENNMNIQDNWIHDLIPGGVAHTDGIQGTGGYTACTITHNAIFSTDTSCVIMQNEASGYSGLVVNNNLLVINAGAACVICRGDKGVGVIGAISITNNKMQKISAGSYNDIQSVTGPVTYTGNTDYITGAAITQGQ